MSSCSYLTKFRETIGLYCSGPNTVIIQCIKLCAPRAFLTLYVCLLVTARRREHCQIVLFILFYYFRDAKTDVHRYNF